MLFIMPLALFAQDVSGAETVEDIRFEHLRVEQGLSQGVVNAILQDSRGYLWFGTKDGLNRYDGYAFVVFRYDPLDSTSIGSNTILALAEDNIGRLWIGTTSGLYSHDFRTRVFARHAPRIPSVAVENNAAITDLHVDARGRIWVATMGGGLLCYNPASGGWAHFTHDRDNDASIGGNTILQMNTAARHHLWLCTYGSGVDLFDTESGNSRSFRPNSSGLTDSLIACVAAQGDSVVWFGSDDGRLHSLDVRTETWKQRTPSKETRYRSPLYRLRHLLFDSHGHLWCGSEASGVFIYNTNSGAAKHVSSIDGSPGGIGGDGVRYLFKDRGGIIWVSINGRGLSYTSPFISQFQLYSMRASGRFSLDFESVRAIYVDEYGMRWIGGYGGLNRIDADGSMTSIDVLRRGISAGPGRFEYNRNIHAIHQHPRKPRTLLLGTEGDGLYVMHTTTRSIDRIPFSSTPERESLHGNAVYTMRTQSDGSVWIGTGAGISIMDMTSSTFIHLVHASDNPSSVNAGIIRSILQDRHGKMWVGSDQAGLGVCDPTRRVFTRYVADRKDSTSLSSNTIYCIHEDGKGRIWIGTAYGLNLYDSRKSEFKSVTVREGLPNDVVYGILEDAQGRLWVSTNRGLACYDPDIGVIATWDARDGLQGNEFNSAAFFASDDGTLFFGGVNGVTYFKPEQLKQNKFIPPIVVTSCRIGNRYLDHEIFDGDTLKLSHSDEHVVLSFAALSFYRPAKQRYRYKIDGWHTDWIELGTDRDVTLAGVSPGSYKLNVLGSNNDGLWNVLGLTLHIQIQPPYYQTAWFRMIAISLIMLLVIGGFRWRLAASRAQERKLLIVVEERTARLKQANEQLLQEIASRKKAEEEAYRANAVKSEFLAHMSHEIRTPMNAILGYTELLQDKIQDKELRDYIESVTISGKTLLRLINDVLDLSRIESGRVDFDYRPVDIRVLVAEVTSIFLWDAEKKGLELVSSVDDHVPPYLVIDEMRFRQILLNLIGNAIKFTERGGVTVKVMARERRPESCTLLCRVSDTGIGVAPAVTDRIFEPFRQGSSEMDNIYGGTGLGLTITKRLIEMMNGSIELRSEVGAGSTFSVSLPDVQCVYADEEISGQLAVDASEIVETTKKSMQGADEAVIDDAKRIALLRLLREIDDIHVHEWRSMRKRSVLHEIERFAETIREAGEQASYQPIILWSEQVLEYVRGFDMDRLPPTLQQFETEIEQLRTLFAGKASNDTIAHKGNDS